MFSSFKFFPSFPLILELHIMSIHLKIKLKSLAEEARIIKKQERKMKGPNWGPSYERSLLQRHRLDVVRPETRCTLLAYGYLRGLSLDHVESSSRTEPDWERVYTMIKKYGSYDLRHNRSRFDTWRQSLSLAS